MPCLCTTLVLALRLTSLTRIVIAFGPGSRSIVFCTLSNPVAVICTRLLPGSSLSSESGVLPTNWRSMNTDAPGTSVSSVSDASFGAAGAAAAQARLRPSLARPCAALPRPAWPASAPARFSWGRCAGRPARRAPPVRPGSRRAVPRSARDTAPNTTRRSTDAPQIRDRLDSSPTNGYPTRARRNDSLDRLSSTGTLARSRRLHRGVRSIRVICVICG